MNFVFFAGVNFFPWLLYVLRQEIFNLAPKTSSQKDGKHSDEKL